MIEMDERFKIKAGETDDEYEIRMCSLHNEGELSWDEIAAIINSALEYNYTESRYRKLWKAYCMGVKNTAVPKRPRLKQEGEYLTVDGVNRPVSGTEETIDPELESARKFYADSAERIANNRELRQDSRFERFYKNIAEAIKTVGFLTPPVYSGVQTKDVSEEQYVVPLADLHLGACFDSVNNKYSISIAEERIMEAARFVVDFIKEKQLNKITVLSLGDMIQGMLRISDVKLNEKAVVDAFVTAMRVIARFLNTISEYCEVDYIQVCYSNHEQPRFLGTKASELASEDMGKILFAYLQDVLSLNKRIHIYGDPEKDYYEFKIFDFNCFAAHGHQVKNIVDVSKDLANRHRKFYDYVFLAHSHSAKELITAEGEHHDIEVLVAPSLIGSDPYADKLMVGSKAAIKILGFNKKYGHNESYKRVLN